MNEQQIRTVVLDVLGEIAPEADLSALSPEADLRQQLDIDSFDFLAFVLRLHERLGVDTPERDYARLQSLSSCTSYLMEKANRA